MFKALHSITITLLTSVLLSSPLAHAQKLILNTNAITTLEPVNIADLELDFDFTFFLDRYLIAKGDVTVRPSAYAPEFGDSDYYTSYYGQVDPLGTRTTLEDWKEAVGFNDVPNYMIDKAEYINAGDLGFGRKMFCINSSNSPCYVQNYLNPETTSEFAATVAMERMQAWNHSFVAFFVFDKNGNRINQIQLDSEGPKSVPESCYACHNGYSHGSRHYGGAYLPFDVNNLKDWPGHPTLASQANNFRLLNRVAHFDASYYSGADPIVDLIEGWYGGAPNIGSTYNENNLPKNNSNWYTNSAARHYSPTHSDYKQYQVEKKLYTDVYSDYCRMCHVAQDLDWQQANAGDFAWAAYNHICTDKVNNPVMPHAEVTFNKFTKDKVHTKPVIATNTITQLATLEPKKIDINSLAVSEVTLIDNFDFNRFIPKYTGQELLCEQLPISFPTPNKTAGQQKFNNTCSGCHYVGSYQANKVGGNLQCKGSWLRQELGTINSMMGGITLDFQDMQNLDAYLNGFSQCP